MIAVMRDGILREKCRICGRYISLTRRGCFRRHMSSPGVVCVGAWQSPEKQRLALERLQVAAVEMKRPDAGQATSGQ